jgi:hypothetical protein
MQLGEFMQPNFVTALTGHSTPLQTDKHEKKLNSVKKFKTRIGFIKTHHSAHSDNSDYISQQVYDRKAEHISKLKSMATANFFAEADSKVSLQPEEYNVLNPTARA